LSLRRRLFITLCIVVLIGFFSIAKWIRDELRNSYSQVVEEILVDYAHLISAHIENNRMSAQSFESLKEMFTKSKTHNINAKIFDFIKTNPSLEMYVTDNKGLVVFSTKEEEIGRDFSQWNDVYKTLRGQYGARSTRIDPQDTRTSVYFVAAPITIDSKLAGVATIYKTESSILVFPDKTLNKMFLGGLFSVIALGLVGGLIMLWITLPLEKLRRYALDVSEGQRGTLPTSNIKEVKHLGDAFEKMRASLEGKKTVEKYTQTLTHELKSPLTAIKGAAELCLEEMDQTQRQQFLKNIIEEANRSHTLLEQLLKIAALESKRQLEQTTKVDLVEILNETKDALIGLWKPKNLKITVDSNLDSFIDGDRFLLFQAFRNILQNAIDFSEPGAQIHIRAKDSPNNLAVEITDDGVGVPDFAKERIFEKFYSLERPDTKRKSSGLGLSFVKEVIELHNGKIIVKSPVQNNRGTSVITEFPKANHG
jgi:two-component system, OmpR family, sensor histidine kinase CreC